MSAFSQKTKIKENSFQETISACIDGEAPIEAIKLPTASEGQTNWNVYHLIGDVLRNPELAILPSDRFQANMSHALQEELPIVAPGKHFSLRNMAGSMILVMVIGISIFWLPSFHTHPTKLSLHSQLTYPNSKAQFDDLKLSDYLEAHRQMTGPIAIWQAVPQ